MLFELGAAGMFLSLSAAAVFHYTPSRNCVSAIQALLSVLEA